jgi:hypothetical protein
MGASDGNAGKVEIQANLSAGPLLVWGVVMFLLALFLAIAIGG